MNEGRDRREVPRLGDPEIPGPEADERGLVWAREPNDEPPTPVWKNRLLVPEKWVEDAVAGALAQHQDEIIETVKTELREWMDELKQSE